jgi:hypothetical protein
VSGNIDGETIYPDTERDVERLKGQTTKDLGKKMKGFSSSNSSFESPQIAPNSLSNDFSFEEKPPPLPKINGIIGKERTAVSIFPSDDGRENVESQKDKKSFLLENKLKEQTSANSEKEKPKNWQEVYDGENDKKPKERVTTPSVFKNISAGLKKIFNFAGTDSNK